MKRAIWLGFLVGLAACGDSTTPPANDAGGSDSGAPVDAPTAGPATHECEDADFVDRTAGADGSRTIMATPAAFAFDQPCMTVRAGQSLTFAWDFAAHPLAAGVAPGHPGDSAEPTPIEGQTTGSTYTVAFPTAGDYAFYCSTHFHSGMLGVVRVVP